MLAAGTVVAGAAAPAALACSDHISRAYWDRAFGPLAGAAAATAATSPQPEAPAGPKQQEQPPAQPEATRTELAAAKPKPAKKAPAKKPKPENAKSTQLRWITGSRYQQTTDPRVLRAQGCRAGERSQNGLVILAFGKPAYNGHTYGTILFSDRFAANNSILSATKAYATGYVKCLPDGSPAQITLARGTSNYHPNTPSTYKAGRKWARDTMVFAKWLRNHPAIGEHVKAAAAIDAEPAWDPSFHKTRDFFRGFRDAKTGYLLYNFGSLDGGVGSIWSLRQAFYVSGGMKDARVVPEIYFKVQAKQWAELARLAQKTYGRSVQFAGVMTQHAAGCGVCGMTPLKAHRTLKQELEGHEATRELASTLSSLTNIN